VEFGKEVVSLTNRDASLSYYQALLRPLTERPEARIVDQLVDGPVVEDRLQFRFEPRASFIDARGRQLHKLRDERSCLLAKNATLCTGRMVIFVSMENIADYQE
jgi:hypothetical protein